MAVLKECNALTAYFQTAYKELYGIMPNVNRNKARWAWDGMLQDMSQLQIQKLIDYYMRVPGQHSLEWFFYNYDKLARAMRLAKEDELERARLRADSAARAAAWKKQGNRTLSD